MPGSTSVRQLHGGRQIQTNVLGVVQNQDQHHSYQRTRPQPRTCNSSTPRTFYCPRVCTLGQFSLFCSYALDSRGACRKKQRQQRKFEQYQQLKLGGGCNVKFGDQRNYRSIGCAQICVGKGRVDVCNLFGEILRGGRRREATLRALVPQALHRKMGQNEGFGSFMSVVQQKYSGLTSFYVCFFFSSFLSLQMQVQQIVVGEYFFFFWFVIKLKNEKKKKKKKLWRQKSMQYNYIEKYRENTILNTLLLCLPIFCTTSFFDAKS
eukprot:TRINITY_DN4358_c1_g1_i3.p3 TRINITY_DN4358_c1_g1~~TRINITY_DN4358_c1_g1_i3.p3  ORF type:complete len:264 (+),score=21.81 TRINITY_DN4358_c1_g1_i3:426-1217(+)